MTADAVFEVFYDGECPLCRREIAAVRRLDTRGRVVFTDIAAPSFDAAAIGRTQAELMARVHGRTADGRLVEGVEVFRQLYAAIGFPRMVALTRLPLVRSALDAAYAVFARNRLRLTGRCNTGRCEVVASAPARAAADDTP